ncbi:MAG: hypothetical protein ACI88L_000627 [Candidatus Paceibacteria bacterium]|jgi:hypothetical protein
MNFMKSINLNGKLRISNKETLPKSVANGNISMVEIMETTKALPRGVTCLGCN